MRRTLLLTVLIFSCLCFLNAQEVRSYDGYGNNPQHPEWGTAHSRMLNIVSNGYTDGISAPAGMDRPNPRQISNELFAQNGVFSNPFELSDFIWVFGQFLDHDVTLTSNGSEFFPILVPQGDPWFDPFNTGQVIIPMSRALFDPATGTSPSNPRAHMNEITAFIDGSAVYGSDEARASWLRTFQDGKMKLSAGGLLPYNTIDGERDSPIDPNAPHMGDDVGMADKLFVAGDERANENSLLLSYHTLFVREHNRLCDELKDKHPDWNDEELFQHARRMVSGIIQAIVYEEWLPSMGLHLPPYMGFNPYVNPTIANVFSTAAFRMGHTMLNDLILRMDMEGNVIPEGHISLKDAFFNPPTMEVGLEPYFKGMAVQIAQELDCKVVDGVRNFLFGPPGSGGLDLVSLNINRGRERGLPDFNTVRKDYGLSKFTSFDQITSNPDECTALENLYGDIDKIDPWVGFLSEEPMTGSIFGQTLTTVLVDQFTRLRDGDRFYYKIDPAFKTDEIIEISNTRMVDVIRRNIATPIMQDEVFVAMLHEDVPVCQSNQPTADLHGLLAMESGEKLEGTSVELFNGTKMMPKAITDNGEYFFSSLATCDDYTISPFNNDKADNGVTTYDLIKIQQHILGLEKLSSPYKVIAADVNNNLIVSTTDLIAIRSVILHNTEEFPNNTSWRFIDGSYQFDNPANPLVKELPESVMVDMLGAETTVDFMAIKTGDIDDSANPVMGLHQVEVDDRNFKETFYFTVDNVQMEAGEVYEIPFYANQIDQLLGFQFTLDFDQEKMDVEAVKGGRLPELTTSNFGFLLDKGAITASWNHLKDFEFASETPVFTLVVKAKENTALSKVITLDSRITKAEAYDKGLDLLAVDLRFDQDETALTAKGAFILHQNQPNPFKDQTIISFTLPATGEGQLTIFDGMGRVLKIIEGDFIEGYNQVILDRQNLDISSGILFYQLQANNQIATRKMLIIE